MTRSTGTRIYRGFEVRRTESGIYGHMDRGVSAVITPVMETERACREEIDSFWVWESCRPSWRPDLDKSRRAKN